MRSIFGGCGPGGWVLAAGMCWIESGMGKWGDGLSWDTLATGGPFAMTRLSYTQSLRSHPPPAPWVRLVWEAKHLFSLENKLYIIDLPLKNVCAEFLLLSQYDSDGAHFKILSTSFHIKKNRLTSGQFC